MKHPLVLSLFPGIGLLDRAFEEEGFCVVRGPDLIWGGDIRRFHPPLGRFDGVIGGPPCQMFSIMKRLNPRAGEKHGNMIPEFERVCGEARPEWFLMENVEGAPLPIVADYHVTAKLISDIEVGGLTSRERRFSFGCMRPLSLIVETLALYPYPEPAVLAGRRRAHRARQARRVGQAEVYAPSPSRTARRSQGAARGQPASSGPTARLPRRVPVHGRGQASRDRERRSDPARPSHRPRSEGRAEAEGGNACGRISERSVAGGASARVGPRGWARVFRAGPHGRRAFGNNRLRSTRAQTND